VSGHDFNIQAIASRVIQRGPKVVSIRGTISHKVRLREDDEVTYELHARSVDSADLVNIVIDEGATVPGWVRAVYPVPHIPGIEELPGGVAIRYIFSRIVPQGDTWQKALLTQVIPSIGKRIAEDYFG
jgi:hypothetical protein